MFSCNPNYPEKAQKIILNIEPKNHKKDVKNASDGNKRVKQ